MYKRQEIGCRVTFVSPRPPEGLRPDIPYVQAGKLRVLGERTVEAVQADSVTLPCEGVFILRPSMAPAELLPGLSSIQLFAARLLRPWQDWACLLYTSRCV